MADPVVLARIVHGQIGVLAAVALLHPSVALPRGGPLRRGTRWSTFASTALAAATWLSGCLLYPGYRNADRPRLFQSAPAVAYLFERKEHLAFYAFVLAIAGAGLAFRVGTPPALRAARRCYAVASLLTFAIVAMSAWVAATPR
jgi:hypothetical protein